MTTIGEQDPERLILDAADQLFASRGVQNVTMAEIRDAAGVSMRRLYQTVGKKPELVARWLDDRDQRWLVRFDRSVNQHIADGATPIDAVFEVLKHLIASENYRGCVFLRTLYELPTLPSPIRDEIIAHKKAFADTINLHVGRKDLILLIDGAITHSVLNRSVAPLEQARQLVNQLPTDKDNPR